MPQRQSKCTFQNFGFLCTILLMPYVTWGLCFFSFSPLGCQFSIFDLIFLYLRQSLENINCPLKRVKHSPTIYPYTPTLHFPFPTDNKNETIHSRLKPDGLAEIKHQFSKCFWIQRKNAHRAAEYIGFDWQLFFLPSSVSGCAIKKSTIPDKFPIQNLFTILLDMMSLGYILTVSKKTEIPARWHNNSGRSFKTHSKHWESRDKQWLASKSEIISPGFLLVCIYHAVFYVPGKSFMVRFLKMSAFGNEVF